MNEEQLKELLKDAWDGGVEYYKDICHNSIIPPITFTEWYADTKQKLNLHGVMQASDLASAQGAAVGNSADGTATCGVDDDGWQCQKTTEPGGVASQCMNGCIMEGNSCEG